MKTIEKYLLATGLLLTATTVSAQRIVQDIEDWMNSNISRVIDAKIDVQKNLGQERDVQQAGAPLKWRCDTYTFTLPKKRRQLLDAMIQALEANGHDNPNCYSINSLTETPKGDTNDSQRNLMIGDDVNRYVTIGKDYNNYLNVNILDAADTTKSHRYAYALEWRETGKGSTDVRYVVTYAKIPSAKSTIIQRDGPYLDFGKSRITVRKGKPMLIKGNARVQWGDKDYPMESLDSLFRDAEERLQDVNSRLNKKFQTDDVIVIWADSLDHDTNPVTDVAQRLRQGEEVNAADLLCNDNILLVFSQLKQQFLAGQNREFNAISVYNLCRQAKELGFFTDDASKEALEQLKREVGELITEAKETSDKIYFGLALSQLMKIK